MSITEDLYDEYVKKSFFTEKNFSGKYSPEKLEDNMIKCSNLVEFHYQTSFFLNFYATLYIELKKYEKDVITYNITKFADTIEKLVIRIDNTISSNISAFNTSSNIYTFYFKTFEAKTTTQDQLYTAAAGNAATSIAAYDSAYSNILSNSKPYFGTYPNTLVKNNPTNINYLTTKTLSSSYFNNRDLNKSNFKSEMPDNKSKFKKILEEVFSQTPENILGYLLYKKIHYNIILYNIAIQNSIYKEFFYKSSLTYDGLDEGNINNLSQIHLRNIYLQISLNKININQLNSTNFSTNNDYLLEKNEYRNKITTLNNLRDEYKKIQDKLNISTKLYNQQFKNYKSIKTYATYVIISLIIIIISIISISIFPIFSIETKNALYIILLVLLVIITFLYYTNFKYVNLYEKFNPTYYYITDATTTLTIQTSSDINTLITARLKAIITANKLRYNSHTNFITNPFKSGSGNPNSLTSDQGATKDADSVTAISSAIASHPQLTAPVIVATTIVNKINALTIPAEIGATTADYETYFNSQIDGYKTLYQCCGFNSGYIIGDYYTITPAAASTPASGDINIRGFAGRFVQGYYKVSNGGSNYVVGDIITFNNTGGRTNATAIVKKTNDQGSILIIKITVVGGLFDSSPTYTITDSSDITITRSPTARFPVNFGSISHIEMMSTTALFNTSTPIFNVQNPPYKYEAIEETIDNVPISIPEVPVTQRKAILTTTAIATSTTESGYYNTSINLSGSFDNGQISILDTQKALITDCTSRITYTLTVSTHVSKQKQFYNKLLPIMNEYSNAYNDLLNNMRLNVYTIGSKSFSQDANIYLYNLYLEKKRQIEINNVKLTNFFNMIEVIKKQINYLFNIIFFIACFSIILLIALVIYSTAPNLYIFIIILCVVLISILMIYFTFAIIQPTRMIANKNYWAILNPSKTTYSKL